MTLIVLIVPLCLTDSFLPPSNVSLSAYDTASKKHMHLSLVLAIEKQSVRVKDMSTTSSCYIYI
jgi:hypothetical protein